MRVFFQSVAKAFRVNKVIETEMSNLTPEEQRIHRPKVLAAMLKELKSWHGHGAWIMVLRSTASNIIDSRWVLKWKMIDGVKAVKARLVVRGLKDRQGDDILTAASTASRWGQRLVCQVVVQMGWKLFSFDVSSAFLQGLPFEQQSMIAPSGAGSERTVHLEIPKGSLELVKQLDGFQSFDPMKHVLKMV